MIFSGLSLLTKTNSVGIAITAGLRVSVTPGLVLAERGFAKRIEFIARVLRRYVFVLMEKQEKEFLSNI